MAVNPVYSYIWGAIFGFLIGFCIPVLMQKGSSKDKDVFLIPSDPDSNGIYSAARSQGLIGILCAVIGGFGGFVGYMYVKQAL